MKYLILIGICILIVGCGKSWGDLRNEFCQDLGHNKSTDYQRTSIFPTTWRMECDNKIMGGWTCEKDSVCSESNKWGDCINHKKMLDCTNYDAWTNRNIDSWRTFS